MYMYIPVCYAYRDVSNPLTGLQANSEASFIFTFSQTKVSMHQFAARLAGAL